VLRVGAAMMKLSVYSNLDTSSRQGRRTKLYEMDQVGQCMRARLAACLATLGLSLIALPVGANEIETLPVEGGQIQLFIEDKPFPLGSEPLEEWVSRSATIVANYYGRFPVAEVFLAIRGRPGRSVRNGSALGQAGAVINVNVGLSSRQQDLHRDWVLIHELIHLAFPSVPRSHHWIEEGLAVYVESIARSAAGELTAEQVWARLDIMTTSELRPVLQLADEVTGTTVLTDLYDDMRAAPQPEELESLWRDLGVALDAGTIVFDDRAPLAAIRQAITATDDTVVAASIRPRRLHAKIRSR
jgi:hypothetical protein